jgi:hypothetical protein
VLEDPDFFIPRSSSRSEVHKAIVGLIGAKATSEWLRKVFYDMWNEKNKKDGSYFWRDLKHLTIPAICNNYASRVASLKFKAKRGDIEDSSNEVKKVVRAGAPTMEDLRKPVW